MTCQSSSKPDRTLYRRGSRDLQYNNMRINALNQKIEAPKHKTKNYYSNIQAHATHMVSQGKIDTSCELMWEATPKNEPWCQAYIVLSWVLTKTTHH